VALGEQLDASASPSLSTIGARLFASAPDYSLRGMQARKESVGPVGAKVENRRGRGWDLGYKRSGKMLVGYDEVVQADGDEAADSAPPDHVAGLRLGSRAGGNHHHGRH
jgi:hypothetical protein